MRDKMVIYAEIFEKSIKKGSILRPQIRAKDTFSRWDFEILFDIYLH